MPSISDLAKKMLGKPLKPVRAAEIENEIIPEAGTRTTGSYTTAWALPEGLEVLPEYEFIKAVITESEVMPIFVTGEAGTGKSTLIQWLVKNVDNCALVAPTSVAAVNIHGSTIHSFFGLPPEHIDPDKEHGPKSASTRLVMENMSCLVIDEISMVPPNMLDAMDGVLRRVRNCHRPFGGVHVIMVGDLFQLPPVVATPEEKVYFTHRYKSPYFFSADVFKDGGADFIPVFLGKVKRQTDEVLVSALSDIRVGNDCIQSLSLINTACYAESNTVQDAPICLVPRNNQAKQINQLRLDELPAEQVTFNAVTTGNVQADKWKLLAPAKLNLKVGARVLFLRNDRDWKNGDLGDVVGFSEEGIRVRKLETDNVVVVSRHTWSKLVYRYDYATRKIEAEPVATFTQYPLALGWAISIHKSQGMTLSDYALDMGGGAFTDGQVYVALSRAKRLDSIKLLKPISVSDVKVSPVVQEFYKKMSES